MTQMAGETWRTSSYTGANGGDCVEVADGDARLRVRDTKNRSGHVMTVDTAAWRSFLGEVRMISFEVRSLKH